MCMGLPSPPTPTHPRWITGDALCCLVATSHTRILHGMNACQKHHSNLPSSHLQHCCSHLQLRLKSTVDLPLAQCACEPVRMCNNSKNLDPGSPTMAIAKLLVVLQCIMYIETCM